MKLNLHIERLVLDGLPLTHAQGPLVQHAVEQELTRLMAGGIAPDLHAGGLIPRATGGAVQFANDASPKQLGTQIAESVHTTLGK